MKRIKRILLALLAILAIVGISYVYAGSNERSYNLGGAIVSVVLEKTRDFERNIHVVETTQQGKITYSVVQTKGMHADLNGLSPSYILVHQGDTVKLAIGSDINCDFKIEGYNINARTRRNTVTEVQFNADLAGTYAYKCDGFLGQNVGLLEVVR